MTGPCWSEAVEMDVTTISRVLWLMRDLRRREMWTETQLRDHQLRQLAKVRGFACANSRVLSAFPPWA